MINEQEKYQRIISRILAGDTNAFLAIVDGHKKLVSRMVWKMINRPAEREDICQDIFFKVYKNLTKFKFECKLSTWIARITYNTCLNYLNKKRPAFYDDSRQPDAGIQTLQDLSKTAVHHLEEQDTSSRLRTEIDRLPVKFRTALMLFHLEEMKYEAIGEIMNLPVGTVKSHLFRARRLLKDKLENKYNREELWQ